MKKYIITILYTTIFLFSSVVYGQNTPITGEYTVLAPVPGTTKTCTGSGDAQKCTADINSYLNGFLNVAISIGAITAMLYIAFYGFQYALSDSASIKMEYKGKLWEITQGLLLIIAAYAIIYTINPSIIPEGGLSIDISTPKITAPTVNTTGSSGGNTINTSGPMTPDQILQSNAVRQSLQTEGVLTYAGPCTAGQRTRCVNLNGLTEIAKDGLIVLKRECGSLCTVSITGGTEPVHSTKGSHPKGLGIDLTPNTQLNKYIGFPNPKEGDTITKTINGRNVKFTYETAGGNPGGTSTGNHWHIDF